MLKRFTLTFFNTSIPQKPKVFCIFGDIIATDLTALVPQRGNAYHNLPAGVGDFSNYEQFQKNQ